MTTSPCFTLSPTLTLTSSIVPGIGDSTFCPFAGAVGATGAVGAVGAVGATGAVGTVLTTAASSAETSSTSILYETPFTLTMKLRIFILQNILSLIYA